MSKEYEKLLQDVKDKIELNKKPITGQSESKSEEISKKRKSCLNIKTFFPSNKPKCWSEIKIAYNEESEHICVILNDQKQIFSFKQMGFMSLSR